MKRKTREEKAITLIALIITIVVLLILAVVAINAVTGDGIIQHATNARDDFEKAQAEEQDLLSEYQQYLATLGNVGPWKQDGNYITMTDSENNTIKIPIGAKVNYTPEVDKTYTSYSSKTGISENQTFTTTDEVDLNWRVIGLENKKIVLMAANGVTPDEQTSYILNGADGYNNGKQQLNEICSIYLNKEYAESARSLNESDIDKMAGLTEEIKKDETEAYITTNYAEGLIDYKAKYKYRYDGTGIKFSKIGEAESDIPVDNIYFTDGTTIGQSLGTEEKSKEIQTSYVSMYIDDKINTTIKEELLSENVYMLWIASEAISVYNYEAYSLEKGYTNWGFKVLYNNGGNLMFWMTGIYDYKNISYPGAGTAMRKVCPVVTLKADVTLTEGENGVYNIELIK